MEKNSAIKIIHEATDQEPFYVIYKPSGLPSAPLKKDDACALNSLAELYPDVLSVKGNKEIEAGLVHRIDTETEGLLLIAKTQSFYDYILNEQKEGRFIKSYSALCERCEINDETFPKFVLDDRLKTELNMGKMIKINVLSLFRSYGIKGCEVRPVTNDSGMAARKKAGTKMYSTEILISELKNGFYKCECQIKEGFRHQVRCHLRWTGFPVKGDSVYGISEKENKMFFAATGLRFINPINMKECSFYLDTGYFN